jgi:hypothetical protein
MISLASTIRLSSFITRGPIHTVDILMPCQKRRLTFFTDQTVVSVVGIVCVAKTTHDEKTQEFVAMLARVSSAARNYSYQ